MLIAPVNLNNNFEALMAPSSTRKSQKLED